MRIVMFLMAALMVTACSAKQNNSSMTLAQARQQYAHLYQDMEKNYSHPAFNWYDKKKLKYTANN